MCNNYYDKYFEEEVRDMRDEFRTLLKEEINRLSSLNNSFDEKIKESCIAPLSKNVEDDYYGC